MNKKRLCVYTVCILIILIIASLCVCVAVAGEDKEGDYKNMHFNRMVLTEENSLVTLSGGAWPGGVDPCNYIIGSYVASSDAGVSMVISPEGGKYGDRCLKITNTGEGKKYDQNNHIYIRVRLDDAGMYAGEEYTLFVFVKGNNLTSNFNPSKTLMQAQFCQSFSTEKSISIGSVSLKDKVEVKDNSFDWTLLSLSFTVQSAEPSCTCLSFCLTGNNQGDILFDGYGIVKGNYSDNHQELINIADNIFDAAKEQENKLGSLKERRISQMIHIFETCDNKDNSELIAAKNNCISSILSADTEEKVNTAVACFSSSLALGKIISAEFPADTADSVCEAVALKDTEWHNLRFKNIVPGSLDATIPAGGFAYGIDTYKGCPEANELIEGIDYEIDYENGRIRRTSASVIPNAGETGFYEYEDKSYTLGVTEGSPNFRYYTFYVTYSFDNSSKQSYDDVLTEINRNNKTCRPDKLISKLNKDDSEISYLVIGDSINTGAEAKEGYTFFDLFAEYMHTNYGNPVKISNYAVGGETSGGGLNQMFRACGDGINPDVITIGFGMNDQNGAGIDIEEFRNNYNQMLKYAKENWPDAQIILLTSIPACPVWDLTSGRDTELAAELVRIGRENKIPVADCNTLSHKEIEAGKHYSEVVTTGINHPGAYGHRLYYLAIASLFDVNDGGFNPLFIIIPAVCIVCGGTAAVIIIKKKKKGETDENK